MQFHAPPGAREVQVAPESVEVQTWVLGPVQSTVATLTPSEEHTTADNAPEGEFASTDHVAPESDEA